MISAVDARYIVAHLDAETMIRRAWRAADLATNAVVILDMEAGTLVTQRWSPEQIPPTDPTVEVLLAWCFAAEWANAERLAALYSEVPPSAEVVVEEGVRACPYPVSDLAVEEQLRRFETASEER